MSDAKQGFQAFKSSLTLQTISDWLFDTALYDMTLSQANMIFCNSVYFAI